MLGGEGLERVGGAAEFEGVVDMDPQLARVPGSPVSARRVRKLDLPAQSRIAGAVSSWATPPALQRPQVWEAAPETAGSAEAPADERDKQGGEAEP